MQKLGSAISPSEMVGSRQIPTRRTKTVEMKGFGDTTKKMFGNYKTSAYGNAKIIISQGQTLEEY